MPCARGTLVAHSIPNILVQDWSFQNELQCPMKPTIVCEDKKYVKSDVRIISLTMRKERKKGRSSWGLLSAY